MGAVVSGRLLIILLAARSFRRSVEGSVERDGLEMFRHVKKELK